MKYELYIFNKNNPQKSGLSNWNNSQCGDVNSIEILFSGNKFKARKQKNEIAALGDFLNRLSSNYRENTKICDYFDDFVNSPIDVELIENFHHIVLYDVQRNILQIDSKLKDELLPIYLFGFYHYLARNHTSASEDDVLWNLPQFFKDLSHESFALMQSYLNANPELDAGDYFKKWLKELKEDSNNYKETQLLRNRSLTGALPYDIERFQEITEIYSEGEMGCFSAEAVDSYYNALKEDLDDNKKSIADYYQHLVFCLNKIGLKVVAQRGSRVAHEQGPILVNGGSIEISEALDLEIKTLRSHLISSVSKTNKIAEEFFDIETQEYINKEELEFNIHVDELVYLINQKSLAKARLKKALRKIDKQLEPFFTQLKQELKSLNLSRNKYISIYDDFQQLERLISNSLYSVQELLEQQSSDREVAVIFVQRPSSRSGHFIPRILLGENLYVETDSDSEEQRLAALPFNFVCPDLELIAEGTNSFFENASISIVTDKDSGKPDIKWANAEDLAVSLAPSLYQAIKAAAKKNERFHYQLETTLIGPLIDLFRYLLEYEISNIASIEAASDIEKQALADLIEEKKSQIINASKFCFEYYLLDDYLEEYLLREGNSRDEAVFEILWQMRDVEKDVAAYCLISDAGKLPEISPKLEALKNDQSLSAKDKAKQISELLQSECKSSELREFSKKYLRYLESSLRKEFLSKNKQIKKIIISSDKKNPEADFLFDFTVAPSRIDFGKHVVASITTLMGRMLGADDPEALKVGKYYLDLVSECQNSLFNSSSEAGSAKVIENTCRAIQYSKAISFQSVFHSLGADGDLIRSTVNSRNNKAAGLHVMEHGTMASTGYCITKEPLFILLALSIDSDELLSKLGFENAESRAEIKELMHGLLAKRNNYVSDIDWQLDVYDAISNSEVVQRHLSDNNYPWLPNLFSLATLFRHIGDRFELEQKLEKQYSLLATKLIEHARFVNESGIIQRVQIMNDAMRKALLLQNKTENLSTYYSKLRIAMNASYKGNVSDERENANQYIIALLLKQKQFIKNVKEAQIKEIIDDHCAHYALPKEIRIFDPYVDPDVFMGGELTNIAESLEQKILSYNPFFSEALNEEVLRASAVSYGADACRWPCISKRLISMHSDRADQLQALLETSAAELRYYELYHKGFFKEALKAYQSCDVIQLNSEHDQLINFLDDLVVVKRVMRQNNPDSLLVLVDNPQQGKKPLLDYDKVLEWLALGGTVASHMVASEKFEVWRKNIEAESQWAKAFITMNLMQNQMQSESGLEPAELREIREQVELGFKETLEQIDLKREILTEKYYEAKEMQASAKSLSRFKESLETLTKISSYTCLKQVDFSDWLILGGRWVLNGQGKSNLDYVLDIFDKSKQLNNISKKAHDHLDLFVSFDRPIPLKQKHRLITNAGSTKEADLLSTDAADSLEFRAQQASIAKLNAQRIYAYKNFSTENKSLEELAKLWYKKVNDYEFAVNKSQASSASKIHGELLKILENFANQLFEFAGINNKENRQFLSLFINQREATEDYLINIFGNHKNSSGLFAELAKKLEKAEQFNYVAVLGEMFYYCFLALLCANIDDENEMVNKLAVFFDQYLNVHEEDYPPYMFHKICAGDAYGFNSSYYMSPNLREKMFKLACESGTKIYKLLHFFVSQKTVLKQSSQEYRDALIGDYDNGIIPLCYQHETICLEERMWSCMRALRNFIRNYHDKHPLPVIIKGEDATVENLFPCDENIERVWIAGLSNPGKHSWDLNCVLRSPLLRERPVLDPISGKEYIIISVFTPYLAENAEIRQIYTAFPKEIIEKLDIIAPYADKSYKENSEGFVHALVHLNDSQAPRADLTMSAHTHPQYIDYTTLKLGVPEAWSFLTMRQMYSKTELAKILEIAEIDILRQIEFHEKAFNDIEEVKKAIQKEVKNKKADHIDFWILKASKDSGGRGISNCLNIHHDLDEMAEFILEKSKTDDVVMQEFVPNNARAFAAQDFLEEIKKRFIEDGFAIPEITPYEQMYFATRAFQSISGIKGYLFSVNIGSATVNAGQGAKMFYGEPIQIMPLYFAGKIQKLMDEYGEEILKHAIPEHAKTFAKANNFEIVESENFSNRFMLNGLFDYIPYFYISRDGRNFKIFCEDNSSGGIDYYYSYFGQKIELCSGKDINESHKAIEELIKTSTTESWFSPDSDSRSEINIGLAVIELNSGLGQANLLQKTIEEMCPENRDLFLEWTADLGAVAQNYKSSSNFKDISANS